MQSRPSHQVFRFLCGTIFHAGRIKGSIKSIAQVTSMIMTGFADRSLRILFYLSWINATAVGNPGSTLLLFEPIAFCNPSPLHTHICTHTGKLIFFH